MFIEVKKYELEGSEGSNVLISDLKPENILLDRFGHLKLGDFGSAIALNENGCFVSLSPVGTPDYIAPELLSILTTKGNQKHLKLDVSLDDQLSLILS